MAGCLGRAFPEYGRGSRGFRTDKYVVLVSKKRWSAMRTDYEFNYIRLNLGEHNIRFGTCDYWATNTPNSQFRLDDRIFEVTDEELRAIWDSSVPCNPRYRRPGQRLFGDGWSSEVLSIKSDRPPW